MSSVRAWAPTGESDAELVASYDTSNTLDSHMNSSTAAVSAAPPVNAPPHTGRPIRKLAALSSPSRLDEAIAQQALAVAAGYVSSSSHHHDQQEEQTTAAATPTPEEKGLSSTGDDDHHADEPSPAAAGNRESVSAGSSSRRGVSETVYQAATGGSNSAIGLLSVASNRQCDAFLDKIRMTSTKSGEAARMGDVAAATAKRAVDAHSPSRHHHHQQQLNNSSSTVGQQRAVGDSSAMTTATVSSPSRFSVRLAVAQQRSAVSSCANIVTEPPSWNMHRQTSEEESATTAATPQANFAVTGPAHLSALLVGHKKKSTDDDDKKEQQGETTTAPTPTPAPATTTEATSAAEDADAGAGGASIAPVKITIAGAHGNDAIEDPNFVTQFVENTNVRAKTRSIAFVDGSIADGAAVAELVRGLCDTKVHSETYLEEKTEEELEEEKAQQEADKAEADARMQNAAGQVFELGDDDEELPDYEYEPPKLPVPEHAAPPPKVPPTMKELTRYIASKRDATNVEEIIIAKNPLAFITRSGGLAPASAIAEPTEEEQALLTAYSENAEAICDAPSAVEALGKYILMFRPELEYTQEEQEERQAEIDENDREEQAHLPLVAAEGEGEGEGQHQQREEEPVYRKPAPLRSLDLSDNALGAVFPTIAPALTQSASIRSLILKGNGLGNPTSALEEVLPRGVGGDGPVGGEEAAQEDVAAALETLVKENKFLEHLSLADNEINSALALRVFGALSESNTRVPTPPPEDPPVFEAFEDEVPPPEFDGDDEVIPTESELDAQERAEAEAEAAENGSGAYGDDDGTAAGAGAGGDEDGENEEAEEGADEDEGGDGAADADGAGAGDDEAEEEEEYDEEVLEARRIAREEAEAKWRDKMEERIWSLQRRQSERDEDKARRAIYQDIIDALVALKSREIVKRKLALSQTAKRSTKERQRRGGFSRLVSLDISGNNIGSEAAEALAQAIRHDLQMTEEEIIAAKEAAGLLGTGHGAGGTYDEEDVGFNEAVDDDMVDPSSSANNKKYETRTRKVARSRYVWRGPNEENDEEHEEAEEFEEDEEYEEEIEAGEEGEGDNDNAAAGEEGGEGDAEDGEGGAGGPAFKTTKPGFQTMSSLNLARCHIGFKGLSALAKVVADNCPSLTSLNLANNPTCRKRIPDPVEVAARKQRELDEQEGRLPPGSGRVRPRRPHQADHRQVLDIPRHSAARRLPRQEHDTQNARCVLQLREPRESDCPCWRV